jgi:hypothetical protein
VWGSLWIGGVDPWLVVVSKEDAEKGILYMCTGDTLEPKKRSPMKLKCFTALVRALGDSYILNVAANEYYPPEASGSNKPGRRGWIPLLLDRAEDCAILWHLDSREIGRLVQSGELAGKRAEGAEDVHLVRLPSELLVQRMDVDRADFIWERYGVFAALVFDQSQIQFARCWAAK